MAVQNTLIKADKNALYDQINNGSTLTSSTLATNDYIGVGDISAATGAKITIANLATFIRNNYSSFLTTDLSHLQVIRSIVSTDDTNATLTTDGYKWYGATNITNYKLVLIFNSKEGGVMHNIFFIDVLNNKYRIEYNGGLQTITNITAGLGSNGALRSNTISIHFSTWTTTNKQVTVGYQRQTYSFAPIYILGFT